MHAQNGEAESQALREPFAVLAVVPTGRHQFNEVVENLQVLRDEQNFNTNAG